MFALTADNLFTFSCQPWEYIKLIILHERRARQTDCRTTKKQFREFLTAVRGILYTRFIYLRLKTTDFWVTYDLVRYFGLKSLVVRHLGYLWICTIRHNWDHAIFFVTTQWLICSHNRMYGKCFGFQHGLRGFQTIFDCW